MRKKGFTVAEILIAIAVAGILAAVVVPTINSVRPNRQMLMLRKAYYLTSRTVNELINDEDFYPDTEDENTAGFSNTTPTTPARYHGRTYQGDGKFCGLFAARMNVRGGISCNAQVPLDDGGNFETADGIVWSLPVGNFNEAGNIEIDLNGTEAPNCFGTDGDCENPDRYRIEVDRWGTITVDSATRAMLTTKNLSGSYDDIR